MNTSPDPIDRYFDLAAGADLDAYLDQFDDDAVVVDEGNTYAGRAALRRWRTSVGGVRYRRQTTTVDGSGATEARAEVSGDFPGSPVTLTYVFTFTADGRVRSLRIEP